MSDTPRLTRRPRDLAAEPAQPAHANASFADEYTAMMEAWDSRQEMWDESLDRLILEQKLRKMGERTIFPRKPYFSPSAATACPRELYMKALGAKKDDFLQPPHQQRWKEAGTAHGDTTQRKLLFIEKHYSSRVGSPAPFVPDRTEEGYPFWEDFVKRNVPFEHRGHRFYLYGKPDGILLHSETGKRVGLELKTKQTTPARTSFSSMKEADEKHRAQTAGYAMMYGVDEWIVPYTNLAKYKWNMTPEEYAKNPDLRAFDHVVTDEDKLRFLDHIAYILDCVRDKTPPPLDLDKWTFNSYKTACALSLTDAELAALRAQVMAYQKSRQPDWKKRQLAEAFAEVEAIIERSRVKTKGVAA